MDKGKIIAFRLSNTLHRDLIRMAETQGCTISDVARNIITEHIRVEDLLHALQETRKSLSHEIAQVRGDSAGNADLAEIRRIVKLIGMAMPSVAKHI
jgi:predicted DNA-binding protein